MSCSGIVLHGRIPISNLLLRSAASLVTICILLLGALTIPLDAQTTRNSPSHRFLPSGSAPQRTDFMTPEYQKAVEAYNLVKELRRALGRSKRNEAQAADTTISADPLWQSAASAVTPSIADQLPLETQELLQDWSKQSVTDVAREIGKDIVQFNQQFRQRTDAPDAWQAENEIPFDFSRDVLQRIDEATKNYREQRKQLNSRYSEALRQFHEKWPSEHIPPHEWLQRVQPFVNAEVLEQLSKVRDFQDGKLAAPPEIPEHLLPPKPPAGLSERVIERVVKSLDHGGNELLKRAQRNQQGKKNTSWWKKLRSDTNQSLRSWNQTMTDRTEAFATAASSSAGSNGPATSVAPNAPASNTPGRDSALGSKSYLLPWVGCSLVAALGFLLYRREFAKRSHGPAASKTLSPDSICDAHSLLQAVHSVAAQRLGQKSRFWHHRQLWASLHRTLGFPRSEMDALYERVRYAPEATLSAQDFERARDWYRRAIAAGPRPS